MRQRAGAGVAFVLDSAAWAGDESAAGAAEDRLRRLRESGWTAVPVEPGDELPELWQLAGGMRTDTPSAPSGGSRRFRGGMDMSGRARLALSAYAATLLAAGALIPLVEGAGWLVQAAVLLGVQSGVGALARRVPLARTLTVAAQALVTLVLLTLVFARDHALLGYCRDRRP